MYIFETLNFEHFEKKILYSGIYITLQKQWKTEYRWLHVILYDFMIFDDFDASISTLVVSTLNQKTKQKISRTAHRYNKTGGSDTATEKR